ncbi:MAG: hypothetical protein LBM99_02390, partial [Bacillales bacterium]|nr:hypothetical protein [Bacillales bacterium]
MKGMKVISLVILGLTLSSNVRNITKSVDVEKANDVVKSYEATDDFVFSDEKVASSNSKVVNKKLNLINNDADMFKVESNSQIFEFIASNEEETEIIVPIDVGKGKSEQTLNIVALKDNEVIDEQNKKIVTLGTDEKNYATTLYPETIELQRADDLYEEGQITKDEYELLSSEITSFGITTTCNSLIEICTSAGEEGSNDGTPYVPTPVDIFPPINRKSIEGYIYVSYKDDLGVVRNMPLINTYLELNLEFHKEALTEEEARTLYAWNPTYEYSHILSGIGYDPIEQQFGDSFSSIGMIGPWRSAYTDSSGYYKFPLTELIPEAKKSSKFLVKVYSGDHDLSKGREYERTITGNVTYSRYSLGIIDAHEKNNNYDYSYVSARSYFNFDEQQNLLINTEGNNELKVFLIYNYLAKVVRYMNNNTNIFKKPFSIVVNFPVDRPSSYAIGFNKNNGGFKD